MSILYNLKKQSWILMIWLFTRITLIFVGWAATLRIPGGPLAEPWPFPKLPLIFTMWDRFDSQWYLAIAQYGYNLPYKTHYSPQAFFPLYPLLIALVHRITSIPYLIVGIIISNIFFILALYILYQLVEDHFGEKIARLSIIFMLIFPTSFYFSAIYTESLFLFGTALSFWAADHKKWWVAGIGGAIAVLTRNLGITLIIPLSIIAWKQYGKKSLKKCYPILLIPIAFSIWAIYLWQFTGNPLQFIHAEYGWGHKLMPPFVSLVVAIYNIFTAPPASFPQGVYVSAWKAPFAALYSTIDGISALIGLIVPFIGRRYGLPWSWVIYSLIGTLVPMTAPTIYAMTPLASMSRYIVVLFPIMVALAQITINRQNLKLSLIISLSLIQAFFFTLFVTWNWIA
ncbi:glycosyltransferase family 39 protein [Thermoanaerobacterium sp. RBIITD]|uniref:glycosyltransferase family 39 protein n=1 Tax=Thermoanaerobacterium sp. RBIITD TaxID=1550240 RepID=UPI000BB97093|nr:glycosyltransferase family 39 protein [Thermoanaerobacterium sp. RBIITD]SNX55037.1 Dolichyl-phosphate-mannose-protein mannosyltransferase [Thermoanaerobacterium sp. RBIITD]